MSTERNFGNRTPGRGAPLMRSALGLAAACWLLVSACDGGSGSPAVTTSTEPDVVIHDILWPDPGDVLLSMLDRVGEGKASLVRATVHETTDELVVLDVGEVVSGSGTVDAAYRADAAWGDIRAGDQALIVVGSDGRLRSAAVWDPTTTESRLPLDGTEEIGWLGAPHLLEWLWARYGGCDVIAPDYTDPAEVITAHLDGTMPCAVARDQAIMDWDFFGIVADVTLREPLVESDSLHRGGPDSGFRSGAMTVAFQDGLVIEVPTGTPGGNWCRDLAVRGARNEECVLAGAFHASGEVAWFVVLDVKNTSRKYGGGRHVQMDGVEQLEGDVLTVRGIPFVVRDEVAVRCNDDASTVAGILATDRGLVADVSISDETVFRVWCMYRH